MKAKLAVLAAVPLMGLSSLSLAQDTLNIPGSAASAPMMLSQTEMDQVTAAGLVTVKTGDVQVIGDVTINNNVNGTNVNVAIGQGKNKQK